MTATINASTTAGVVTTADTSGILQLQTNGTAALTVDASQRTAFVAGTAALPAITTTGDTNTGIFFPAADTIGFATAGTEAMRIDSSGNLTIKDKIQFGTDAQTNIQAGGTSDVDLIVAADTNLRFETGTNERARIDSSGNLLVGQTTAAVETGSIVTAKNLEITRTIDSDGGALGQLSWVNNTNAGVASGTSFAKDVTCIKGLMDGTGNNSGGYLTFETKADAGTRAERMRIDSSGKVGINTTTPARTLHVKGGGVTTLANGNGALFTDASNAGVLLGSDNVLGYISGVTVAGNATADLVLQPFGASVLVGTTSASNTAGVGIKFIPTATAPGTYTVFNTSGGENTYHLYNTNATNNGYRFYVNVNGGILNYSGNNSNLSDVRTKTNIVLSGSYLEKICAIPVKQFNYKDEADGTQQTLGVIAQDVEAVAPELVNTEGFGETPEDGIPLKAVYTTDMQFALMKCIQEQQALITALTTRITALGAEIAALKGATA